MLSIIADGAKTGVGLSVIRRITDLWAAAKSDSLIDYTKVTRVEPLVLIDSACMYRDGLDVLPDVMSSLHAIFTGYYLQAIAISLNVGKIEVRKHLDRLNPNRAPLDGLADSAGFMMAQESYRHRLPRPDNSLAMEAEQIRTEAVLTKDTVRDLNELSNLSVGRMVSVEISDGCHKAQIPVSIRMIATSVNSQNMVQILGETSKDLSVKERYHAWRAGRLEFIKDLWLCQDLIDAHRKGLMKDESGVMDSITTRSRNNRLTGLLTANPSIATASNIAIIDSETASKIELEVNGRLSDFKVREKIFSQTYLMILVVIDTYRDRVTFYHRSLPDVTSLNSRSLKSASKGNGPNINEILTAFQSARAPQL